jgi:DNA-binding MarR family transcriptional regulator
MNYRKIPQSVADELRPLEAYLYLLLASKSDYNTLESKVNQSTLAELSGLDIKTIRKHLNKMESKGIIKVQRDRKVGASGAFKFNTYYLTDENYSLISVDLLNEPIRKELIGFLVQLKLRCWNYSNLCRYSVRELADTLPYTKSTVDRYLIEAELKGYIKRNEKGIILVNTNLFIVDKMSEFELIRRLCPEILTDEDYRDRIVHY